MTSVMSLLMVGLLFLGGCGKKKDKHMHDHGMQTAFLDATDRSALFAEGEEAEFLDEEEAAAFALLDEELEDLERALDEEEEELELSQADDEEEGLLFEEAEPVALTFALNGADVDADQERTVEEMAEEAREAIEEGREVALIGHTCQLGNDEFNSKLSLQRAEVVKEKLVAAGVPADKITTQGKGCDEPVVWSNAEDRDEMILDLAVNRRVELRIS